ncbi:MAG TPA: F0F1 ATP synthase subunit A [Candidatus Tectomicrobia bacterium]|nr:F0F1 ATP synthase subunit A [Candidatus Tectomicrobia bacterium]
MAITDITPDQVVIWRWGFLALNATILYTWLLMLMLTLGAWLVTRKLSTGPQLSCWQNLLEILVSAVQDQIRGIGAPHPDRYLPFIGTLLLFIGVSNLLTVIPGYLPPTGSLSTTVALALCVFVAVPVYGIADQGLGGYLKNYVRPTVFMLPFNVIGELSRTLALAVRLFGNVMSGVKIAAILLSIAPLFFPILMQALGLLTGLIQAYIFAILAMVYIASATRVHRGHAQEEHGRQLNRGKE